jgi:hypothetical protein
MAGDERSVEIDIDVGRAIERARLSFGERENDILRRLLLARPQPMRPRGGVDRRREAPRGAARTRGLWTVEIGGRRLAAANLKDAYCVLLRELAAIHPDFLQAFADEKTFGRRFVARSPAALYGRSPHLAGRHALRLGDGWYFDSNLSSTQVAKRARIAARLCGLFYGSDVRILDNLREI